MTPPWLKSSKCMDLRDVITLTLDDVRDLKLENDDVSYAAKSLNHHTHKLKDFLLLYNQ
jgi:hypothetical protein